MDGCGISSRDAMVDQVLRVRKSVGFRGGKREPLCWGTTARTLTLQIAREARSSWRARQHARWRPSPRLSNSSSTCSERGRRQHKYGRRQRCMYVAALDTPLKSTSLGFFCHSTRFSGVGTEAATPVRAGPPDLTIHAGADAESTPPLPPFETRPSCARGIG